MEFMRWISRGGAYLNKRLEKPEHACNCSNTLVSTVYEIQKEKEASTRTANITAQSE
jgi:hypothetical protein